MVVSRSMSLGMAANKCGIAAFTLSTVSMMLAPGWRNTTARTAGLPCEIPACRRFSTESRTSATSDSRTAASLR